MIQELKQNSTMVKKAFRQFTTHTEEVTWADGKPTKWRTHIRHKNGVQIWGDPKPTKAAAIRSMEQEVLRVAKAANEVVYILELEQ